MRLDRVLVEKGIVSSRQRAKELIGEGQVLVDGKPGMKPSLNISSEAKIEVLGNALPYPSRAGLKLEKALRVFDIQVEGCVALDVGASTGGFTSCLLQAGAKLVIAVDVGQDQLVEELRSNPRVKVFEKTNIRDLTLSQLPRPADLATVDVSFISLTKVLPTVQSLLTPQGQVVALVKPQFETEGDGLNKHGVIQDQRVHLTYLPPLIQKLQGDAFGLLGFDYSPISGVKGNIEYLAHFGIGSQVRDAKDLVLSVIKASWSQLQ
ncbi:MAG TPA: TlyA family RNA methyltransferase [Limnochordia bacterium]|jgi:23S rRNA (cytidine1920-2'-O)/16S rRNA (cytidine1409-2'-O)-methyltransferase|nr:TlyA family RNA methyltransferase [Limnochordia bacterium]